MCDLMAADMNRGFDCNPRIDCLDSISCHANSGAVDTYTPAWCMVYQMLGLRHVSVIGKLDAGGSVRSPDYTLRYKLDVS